MDASRPLPKALHPETERIERAVAWHPARHPE